MLETNVHRHGRFREVASISHAIKTNEYIPSKVSGIKGSQTPNPSFLHPLCVHQLLAFRATLLRSNIQSNPNSNRMSRHKASSSRV
jgi:hypothetical protein